MERREPIPLVGKPIRRASTNDDTSFERVGAFAVAGMGIEDAVVAVSSVSGDVEAAQESPVVPVYDARVVDEETASPIVEVMPMEELESPETATSQRDAPSKNRNRRIIVALAAVLALVVGVIVAVVLVTQNASKTTTNSSPTQAPQSENNETVRDEFLAELTPLLTNESLSALDNPDSPQSLSIGWLLGTSNFQEMSFQRQVQRYAMATIYYGTGGTAWSNIGNWMTSDTECTWVQGSAGDFCDENGTLHYLNQSNNALIGKIPDEIRLLRSLKVIDLNYNKLYGTIPVDIFGDLPSQQDLVPSNNRTTRSLAESLPLAFGSLTALTWLSLDHNAFTGTLASDFASLTALTRLTLEHNLFKGTVPSELGSLTALTRFSVDHNSLTGTVPTELGSLTALNSLSLSFNTLRGSVPSELGSLTALTWLSLFWNTFTGPFPSEIDSLSMTIFP
jgi:hypothetical protein